MQVGDLVIMPGAVLADGETQCVGIVVADDDQSFGRNRKHIGIVWTDGGGAVDYEPQAWLEVVSESQ